MCKENTRQILLRDLDSELVEKVMRLTDNKTASGAISYALQRFVYLENLTSEQLHEIRTLEGKLDKYKSAVSGYLVGLEVLATVNKNLSDRH